MLKCFCGCSELTEDEVKRIHYLNVAGVLDDNKAIKILNSYLKSINSGDDSDIVQYINIHKKVTQLIADGCEITEDDIEELSEMGLRYELERKLQTFERRNNPNEIYGCLLEIQNDCQNEIELHQHFKGFKNAMLRKLRG